MASSSIRPVCAPLAEMPPRAPSNAPSRPNVYDMVRSFKAFLLLEDNEDLAQDFPDMVRGYQDELPQIYRTTLQAQQRAAMFPHHYWPVVAYVPGPSTESPIEPGKPLAIGWSTAKVVDSRLVPRGIDPAIPSFSLLVLEPYRGRGIGTLLAKRHVKVADKQFGGQSWTSIRATNVASRHVLEKVGFVHMSTTIERDGPMRHYVFGA